jgi:hypothetical protein
MKARRAADALSSHEVAMDISKERREGKKEDPKGTGAPAWQNPMRKSSLPEKVKKGEDLKQ